MEMDGADDDDVEMESETQIVLHEDKKYYPEAEEVSALTPRIPSCRVPV